MTPRHLFVYGTLRRGQKNKFARLLHSLAPFAGAGRVAGRLYRYAWFPGAVLTAAQGEWIRGDVFHLQAPEKVLPALDVYESFAFERTTALVNMDSGQELEAWIYVYRGTPSGRRIVSGVWQASR